MRLYRHWARAESPVGGDVDGWTVARYAGSNVSEEAAHREAERLARETAEIFRVGDRPDGYLYSDRPLREEIVDEIVDGDETIAVMTRNAYGSLVLNTAFVMFIDIDDGRRRREPVARRGGLLSRLFGRATEAHTEPEADHPVQKRLANVVDRTHGLGMRLYRTAAGHRCLITSRIYDPTSPEAVELMRSVQCDPLYLKLCAVQECFRARLSPKFWRCGGTRPPVRFPWANDAQEIQMREWESAYHAKADRFATCEFVATFGSTDFATPIDRIVALHDEVCCRPGAALA
jgi:hypothetical protein